MIQALSSEDQALCEVLQRLKQRDYHFVTPTPRTHARYLARAAGRVAATLEDIFGWNLPFDPIVLDAALLDVLRRADALTPEGAVSRSKYRVSACEGQLFLHGAFPTEARDAVFFGPDSYRFAACLRRALHEGYAGARLCDIGAGAGVGALTAALHWKDAELVLTDINPLALRLARINAAAGGHAIQTGLGEGMKSVEGAFDLILANPPYLVDAGKREYRDGGRDGIATTIAWCTEALPRLTPDGALLLYSASPIVDGVDVLRRRLTALAQASDRIFSYEELDPDVWGEELGAPAYAHVDRIAIIWAVFRGAGSKQTR